MAREFTLTDKPCCKFMFKYDTENYSDNLRKLLVKCLTFSEINHIETC